MSDQTRISIDGVVATKISDGATDFTGELRDWIVESVPEDKDVDVWIGFPLFNYEVEDWAIHSN